MHNPLESLDELILNKVFEPITQYAHKKLGWTKYDLMRIAYKSSNAFSLGAALYEGLCLTSTVASESPNSGLQALASAMVFGVLGSNFYDNYKKIKESFQDEEKEIKNSMQGVTTFNFSPIKPIRPIFTAVSLSFLGFGAVATFNVEKFSSPEYYGKYATEIAQLGGLFLLTYGLAYTINVAGSYFKDTTFFPPGAKKKKIFKTLYEGIKSKIPGVKVPEPVTVPVQNYSLEDGL